MIDYPPRFPESAKAAVERAIADTEYEFQERRDWFSPSEAHRPSVYFAVTVFEVFLGQARAVAVDERWTATRLREGVSRCLDRLIIDVFAEKHPQHWNPSVELFRAAVHKELRTSSFWTRDYQDTLRELTQSRPYAALGTRIRGYRQQCGWRVDDLASAARFHRTSVIAHESGAVCPTETDLREYAAVFTKQLGHKVTVADLLTPDPDPA